MPWTRRQVKYLLSSGTPLSGGQRDKMIGELHADPSMGHAQKGSATLKRGKLSPASAAKIRAKAAAVFGK